MSTITHNTAQLYDTADVRGAYHLKHKPCQQSHTTLHNFSDPLGKFIGSSVLRTINIQYTKIIITQLVKVVSIIQLWPVM